MTKEQAQKRIAELEPENKKLFAAVKAAESVAEKANKDWMPTLRKIETLRQFVRFCEMQEQPADAGELAAREKGKQ